MNWTAIASHPGVKTDIQHTERAKRKFEAVFKSVMEGTYVEICHSANTSRLANSPHLKVTSRKLSHRPFVRVLQPVQPVVSSRKLGPEKSKVIRGAYRQPLQKEMITGPGDRA